MTTRMERKKHAAVNYKILLIRKNQVIAQRWILEKMVGIRNKLA